MPRTDIRLQINIATVKLEPCEMTEADLRAPAAEFARMQHANERAKAGKLFIHKADCLEFHEGGDTMRGAMQSAMFDIDKSNGKNELKEFLDFIRDTTLERLTQPEGIIIGPHE